MTSSSTPSTPVLEGGRTRQKLRTRNALIAAARDLIGQGTSPTVEDAAAASSISRTTAYRYFRNQAELLAAAHPEIQRKSLLPIKNAPSDPGERLDVVVREMAQMLISTEAQQRTMLRLSLEPKPQTEKLVLRQGRAIGWIEDALSPLKGELSKAHLGRLVLAIRASIGIEAFVWLTDVAGLSKEDALKNMRWSAKALFRSALAEKNAK